MIVLHAIWSDSTLHLWGWRRAEQPPHRLPRDGTGARANDGPVEAEQPANGCVGEEVLRQIVGDLWDSLLMSEATGSRLTLLLPHLQGRLLDCDEPIDPDRALLKPTGLETLAFAPAEAIDLLTTLPRFERRDVRCADSLLFWSRGAALVLELLATQQFVPDIYPEGADRYRGFWRAVIGDERTSRRVGRLVEAMPPACRALASDHAAPQASALVENFLWTTVDALVRRSLAGDELARALQERPDNSDSLETRWLRSLVRDDPRLEGPTEEGAAIWGAVQAWLVKLEPVKPKRGYRTCFKLHPPEAGEPTSDTGEQAETAARAPGLWRLTLHVQALQSEAVILDAEQLYNERRTEPLILERPFEGAKEQLRVDLEKASRFFPPLGSLAREALPTECALTGEEAYHFLHDALPMLEHEDFGVWVPRFWRSARRGLGMRLHIRAPGDTGGGVSTMGLGSLVDYDWRVALGDKDLSLEEITDLANAKTPLVQLRGQWIEIQPSDVRSALRFLTAPQEGRMTVFEALRRSYLLDDPDTGLPVVGLRAEGWLDRLLRADVSDERVEPLVPPQRFVGTLRPYQLKGLEWFHFLTRCGLGACLADDMGLGKTIQLIALWLQEREGGVSPGPTLLVVPMSLVGNWQREIERFAPSLRVMAHHGTERLAGRAFVDQVERHDVVISTYGLIHRDHKHLTEVRWHRVALDEAQAIKNPTAKQSAAIRALGSVHRVALTGTPVENRLSELWSIMEFLNPGYLGSARDFHRRFAVPIERHNDREQAERLRHLIRPFVLRRLKSDPDILNELPAKMEMKVFCNLTREQAALYEALVSEMLGQIEQSQGMARRGLILAVLMKLKQICNHPALFLRDPLAQPHRSGKCDRLTEMLEEVVAEGDCALVFTQFRKMGELLRGLLQEGLDREILFLHGGMSKRQRDTVVERFQRGSAETPVMLLSLKAGGVGLNLTAARHVFHFDRWWNPAVEDQATDRAHRIGQEKQVQVHKYVCIGTLEERIDAMIENKRSLAANIIGSGEAWLTELSTGALRELLILSRDAVAEE